MITAFLAVLAFYLWITGGLGWINFYELIEDTEFNTFGKAIVFATWPFMGLVAASTQVWDVLREMAAELAKIVKEKAGGKDNDVS